MSQSSPYDNLLNSMSSAINLDNEVKQEVHEHHKKFNWQFGKIFAGLAVIEATLGTILGARLGFSPEPIDPSDAVTVGVLIVGGALTGFVAMGPGGNPKDKSNPRDLPPLDPDEDDEKDE